MDMMAKHKKYTLMTVVLLLICACGFYVYKTFMPGRILNIYCWDNSFRELLAKHYPAYNPETEMIGNVKVRWVVVPYTNHVYQHTALEEKAAADAACEKLPSRADAEQALH